MRQATHFQHYKKKWTVLELVVSRNNRKRSHQGTQEQKPVPEEGEGLAVFRGVSVEGPLFCLQA